MRCTLLLACLACSFLILPFARAGEYLDESFAAQEAAVAQSCDCCNGVCCDSDCCDGYECCDCFNGRKRFLGLLPSDHCFDSFVSPLSNPFFFEDPRSLTEVRGIFIDNSLPGFLGGGDFQLYAAQLRGRITDRLSVIAPRLGYLNVNQASGGAPWGLLSSPVGVKYNFLRDVERQTLASIGMTYFIKGSGTALSNFGDGDFHFFLTGGTQIFDRGHWISGTGFRIPGNNNFGTQLWYWSNQWDYEVVDHIYGLVGLNWYHWMRSSNLNAGAPVTGLDIMNIPITGVAGKNVVTAMVGGKWKPSGNCEIGSGFEFPLTNRTDILKNRLYVDFIFRY